MKGSLSMPIRADAVPWSFTYTAAFPLKIFFTGKNTRILLTYGISHNYRWIHHLRDTDQVVTLLPWSFEPQIFEKEKDFLLSHKHRLQNWHILCNTFEQVEICKKLNLNGYYVNHNCFLDERLFSIRSNPIKLYDAIYNARLAPFKRHYLTQKIHNLALIVGYHYRESTDINLDSVPHIYHNTRQLSPVEVSFKVQDAYCGLILSAEEGACYSSSEYLLSGIPVVSTASRGGRDIWYNQGNSILCNSTPHAVAEASYTLRQRVENDSIDSYSIRNDHITMAHSHRITFIDILTQIFNDFKENIDAHSYFKAHFTHKMIEDFIPLSTVLQRLGVNE
jgi:hypothetical protein